MGQDAVVLHHGLLTGDVEFAAGLLAAGGLVGMPTETVYGLAADAQNPAAVARVYAVKGRPADHPLIVHVRGTAELADWAASVPDYALRLARRYWPGPLTLVLWRTSRAGDHVTGGQPTVGLRAPAHPLAQRLLAAFGGGIAAPSANRFGRVSPTTAPHVLEELGEWLLPGRDAVLDGGPSQVGVESSILDCTGPAPVLLRPGAVSAADVARVGGVPPAARPSPVRAPGTLASHYAPRARVVLVQAPEEGAAPLDPAGPAEDRGDGVPGDGFLAPAGVPTPAGAVRLSAPADAADYARALYSALREADALGLGRVLAVPPSGEGLGSAVRDRLLRAAAGSA
jgi:L-threonylcarbamoyladenylate synthase